MRIATWNVNSVRARLQRVADWITEWEPDLLCMQETKVVDAEFPREAFESLGYGVEVFGQKTYNGVAMAFRKEPSAIFRGFPDDLRDADRRLIGGIFGDLRVINVYAPNGTQLGTERFTQKLEWFRRLRSFLEASAMPADPVLICGDFNVVPEDRDVYDPELWRGRLLFTEDEHQALDHLMDWGLIDAFRLRTPEAGHYSWWDYRAGMFHKGQGLRIDLILVTNALVRRTKSVVIDRNARKGPKPSDHAPVIIDL
ncbi:MAG: exodeoxyribonuclease III [Candidatus Eisenbacteria sp.]|nr:exodeoxyribonuclease III [Candidatus Eisenbacteria bacterium]